MTESTDLTFPEAEVLAQMPGTALADLVLEWLWVDEPLHVSHLLSEIVDRLRRSAP